MPNELGGRADKRGNRFEFRWVIYQILKVLDEKLDYIVLEPLGDDEQGVDIWIGKKNGSREGQQCKGRNGSKEYWDYGTANGKGIFTKWKYQLDRDKSNTVALVSPLAFTLLEDLIERAKNTSNNLKDFYNNQILSASKEFIDFFKHFCKVMEINPEQDLDLAKCISYLNRIAYRQFPDAELKELIISKISYLLVGNEEEIYEAFIAWIVDGDVLGKTISQSVLYEFLKEKNIKLKELATDKRIMPRLEELNQEYRIAFIPLNNGLINRKEFSVCRKAIDLGDSLIIHGKAGRGKSGCTEDIINYCQEQTIPYLAIKLDKRIPTGTAEKWGKDLELPASIAHCIHSVSKNERAVIILDQLDALRWTQAHSRDALLVCAQIIDQLERLNLERKYKISVVFVCRTYDLENDNNIRSLFKKNDKKEEVFQWNKVQVNELDEGILKEIVGKRYEQLSSKLKEILRIPSNLYIWQQLDPSKEYAECSTASHLVSEWWGQLSGKCFEFGLSEADLNETKEKMVTLLEKLGRIFIPLRILNVNKSGLDFLSSNAFLVIQDNKVSFAHQSILDCFLAEKMLKRYYDGEDVVDIIGSKEKQTPGKRYQVQMFMQNLSEFDSQDFINAGQKMFEAKQIRYFIKFVFLEVLNQIDILDENVKNFIISNCENETYGSHIINNVIFSRPKYIRLFRKYGIFDKWFIDSHKKDIVFNLLISMSPDYESEDISFIEKYAFHSQEDDNKFSRCFLHDINQDTDELFELRMKFYSSYPQMANVYLDFKSMLKNCEIRTIRLLAFLLENKIKCKEKNIYKYEEEFIFEDSEILITNGMEVVNLLLPYIPTEKDERLSFSDWSGRYFHKRGLERACIQIIKKANAAIIALKPETFFQEYKEFMGKGIDIYNEIILDGLYRLPEIYSDVVINYLCSDFDSNIFDQTSGNGDELLLIKQILEKHSQYCSEHIFAMLEKTVLNYLSPKAKDIYLRRIDINREKNGYTVYWSFWGDLQKEILEVLPNNRLSDYAKDLMRVLKRKFPEGTTLYKHADGHFGWVSSSIAGKKLNNKKWLEILTNTKLKHKGHSRWQEVPGGFIENSIEQFSSSFRNAVSEEPERMIKLVLIHKEEILDVYVDSLFGGVAHSKVLDNVPIELLETMILSYPYDYTSYRANYICSMIESRKNVEWSKKILDILKDIAINHKNPEISKPNVTNNEDKEMRSFDMMHSNALNCVRGKAALAIARLLWNNDSLFKQFKDTIEKLTLDENPAVKLASLFTLWPSYNIEREWASDKIINLYEQDYRLAGFHDTKNMLFFLYPKYRERVLKIIKNCYESEDKDLIKMGAYCLSEMFILKNEFADIINDVDTMSETQAEAVLHMAIIYFNKDEFNSLAKNMICKFKKSILDLEMPISRLFYDNRIDLERDKDFLIELMNSGLSRRTVHAFVHYLEEESKSVVDYKDIILSMSYHLVENGCGKNEGIWGIEDEISKLIIGLYDETSESSLPEMKSIANECLDIWDLMFERQIGPIRFLSQKLMER
ncbi:hypothetical protein [Sporomusa malonica]|uniref:ATPase family associated with various cellular activities (AAA) n=1 Tax=Sporomusa malonica TaxID=112901 RepID=A0A1W1YA31_9FIRM|nr:hypothetical protein [Sporomusa malonica]SMC32701.1 hypothetical protein SAMN04488500_101138 [Sporomusa malonica]